VDVRDRSRRFAAAPHVGRRVTYIAHIDSVKLPTHQPVPRSIILICDVHDLAVFANAVFER
jgi:hypothetical protein